MAGKKLSSVLAKDLSACLICGRPAEIHHVFFGSANRAISERYGYIVPLCPEHHRTGEFAVHRNRCADLMIKQGAQKHFEAHVGSREEFIKIFGRSWIE